jgi:hypothetical protein
MSLVYLTHSISFVLMSLGGFWGLTSVFAEENEEKNIKATDLMELAKPDPTNQLSESGVAADRIEIGMGS